MGKKRFAATLDVAEHSTTTSKYGSNIEAWIRGWDYGVEVFAHVVEGEDVFDIWVAGGSNARSNGRKMIGRIVNGEFRRSN